MEQPKTRLLHCRDCGTVEALPDYHGPVDQDYALEYVLSKHGSEDNRHIGKLYDIETRVWALENLRRAVVSQIKGGGSRGLAEFDSTFYDVRDTLKEDALQCYQLHRRPTEGCIDWREDRKLLVPPTKGERKELGLTMDGAPKRYLCDFCPARAFYERKNRGE